MTQLLHLRLRDYLRRGGQKEEPKNQDVCFETVPSMYVREAELMKSQQDLTNDSDWHASVDRRKHVTLQP